MRIKVAYNGLEDRQAKIKEQEAKGLRMLHDDFDDPNWKHGDPMIGTMTFTDEPTPVASIEPGIEPGRDIFAEIDNLKVRIEKLERR